jgi:5-methylcytosine-specific restriction protein A
VKRNNHGRIQGRRGQQVLERRRALNPLCAECLAQGIVSATHQIDHIIPLSKGGTDTDDNTQGLCRTHHEAKTAKDLGYRIKPEIGADGWPIA